jgi:hypothetical protein
LFPINDASRIDAPPGAFECSAAMENALYSSTPKTAMPMHNSHGRTTHDDKLQTLNWLWKAAKGFKVPFKTICAIAQLMYVIRRI